ncbi:MAG: amidohydrolase family protein [Clostridia bacterium]|nr:amidohydrolase family protein [Clostridia bacterium]
MVIDFHTHCFPDKIAERAMAHLSHESGLIPYTDGTVSGLKSLMQQDGVDISCVLSIATNSHQQTSVNNFAASIACDEIVPFGSVCPDAEDAIEELERIQSLGMKGVKFHPEYQAFFIDDEKMKPIYKKISELGLITVFHAGEDYGYMPPYHATPERIYNALKWFDSPVIAAHWGSQGMGLQTLRHLCGIEHLYFDTAFGYASTPKPIQQAILEKHGTDKILFASDCPWHAPSQDLFQLSTLALTDTEREQILSGNARRLLNI